MASSYPVLSWKEFGKHLLTTQDLDPVYTVLAGAVHHHGTMGNDQLLRFCLAYWCFYSVGVAAWISEAKTKKTFFERMQHADVMKLPRGKERRHFRGQQSAAAIRELADLNTSPENIVTDMAIHDTFRDVERKLKNYRGFGPWMTFKVADMAERVIGHPVSFEDCELDMYREPVRGAALIEHGDPDADVDLKAVVKKLMKEFGKYEAPPFHDRTVGLQEIETILCKYKSHHNGHYPLMNDIHEVGHSLRSASIAQPKQHRLPYASQTADNLELVLEEFEQ